MGSKAEFMAWYYRRNPDYSDINNSIWFKDLVEKAVKNSERHENRLYIYFSNAKDALNCIEKCKARNFSHIDGYMENVSDNTYRVDILMNWKERRPSKSKRNLAQNLNERRK